MPVQRESDSTKGVLDGIEIAVAKERLRRARAEADEAENRVDNRDRIECGEARAVEAVARMARHENWRRWIRLMAAIAIAWCSAALIRHNSIPITGLGGAPVGGALRIRPHQPGDYRRATHCSPLERGHTISFSERFVQLTGVRSPHPASADNRLHDDEPMPIKSDKDLAAAFGQNLVRVRRSRNISQDALALATGFSRDTVGKLERGKRLPRLDTLMILCDVLKVEPNDLTAGLKAGYEPKVPLP